MQSRKNNPGHANNNNNNNQNNMNNMGNHNMRPPFGNMGNMGNMPNNAGHNMGNHNMRPPLINRPQRPPPNGPLISSQPRMGGPYNNQGGMQNQNLWNHPPQNMGPQSNQSGPINRGRGGPMHNNSPRPNLGGPPVMGPRMPGKIFLINLLF